MGRPISRELQSKGLWPPCETLCLPCLPIPGLLFRPGAPLLASSSRSHDSSSCQTPGQCQELPGLKRVERHSLPGTVLLTCSVIRKCLSGSCHSDSNRRTCCLPNTSGWLRSALRRTQVERRMLLFLAPAKVSLGALAGGGEGVGGIQAKLARFGLKLE